MRYRLNWSDLIFGLLSSSQFQWSPKWALFTSCFLTWCSATAQWHLYFAFSLKKPSETCVSIVRSSKMRGRNKRWAREYKTKVWQLIFHWKNLEQHQIVEIMCNKCVAMTKTNRQRKTYHKLQLLPPVFSCEWSFLHCCWAGQTQKTKQKLRLKK